MKTGIIKIDCRNSQLVAHRGLSGIELENTCASFVAACNQNYWAIETDVHHTSDGKFVLIHDYNTGRVCSEDLPVEGSSFKDMRALQLKDIKNSNRLRSDLRIPTPEEYFSICKRYEKTAVLEIKGLMEKTLIGQLVEIADTEIGLENVIFISFHPKNLLYVREFASNTACQILTGEVTEEVMQLLLDHKMDLDINHIYVTPELVERLHKAGIKVNCWTVDDPARGEALAQMGVDYITTNILCD